MRLPHLPRHPIFKGQEPLQDKPRAFIAPGGKKAMLPGYYFHVQPKMYFSAAGKHMPDNTELLKIRNHIAANTKDFFKIVEGKKFRDRFGEFHGDRLTKPPKGFDPAHPAIEYLKLKSFTVGEEFSEKEALSKDYPKMLADSFKAAYPLVEFLRSALR